jgi:hypothetical protein
VQRIGPIRAPGSRQSSNPLTFDVLSVLAELWSPASDLAAAFVQLLVSSDRSGALMLLSSIGHANMNVLKLQRYAGAQPSAGRASCLLTLPPRKFPQFQQGDIFSLTDTFRKLDVDDKGYIDEATAIKATQQSERQPYDVVRQALKEVDLDSSRRVELEDYVGVRTPSSQRTRGLLPHTYTPANSVCAS